MLNRKQGFSLIELLVVLVIIGVLAAVATPLYLQNTQKAKASEAIATMGLIRQAMRDFKINRNTYYNIKEAKKTDVGFIQNGPPSAVATDGKPTPDTAGIEVDAGVTQYFSNQAFYVDTQRTTFEKIPASIITGPTKPVDFVIYAKGENSNPCDTANEENCAIRATEVEDYEIQMDNSGRIFICYENCDTGANWKVY